MTYKISFINYKGGVAKTTTAYHVACALAEKDEIKKVLLVDIDPQMNCTLLCSTPKRWEIRRDENKTLYHLFDSFIRGSSISNDLIWLNPIQKSGKSILQKLDLIPGNIKLLETDMQLGELIRPTSSFRELAEWHLNIRTILDTYIRSIETNYDLILFDCPPNLYYLTQNALAASDWYVIPTIPDYLSTIGLSMLNGLVEELGNKFSQYAAACSATHLNGFAKLKGLVFCRARKSRFGLLNLHKSMISTVKKNFPEIHIFESMTTEAIGFGEASRESLPIWLSRKLASYESLGDQYRNIADELYNLMKGN